MNQVTTYSVLKDYSQENEGLHLFFNALNIAPSSAIIVLIVFFQKVLIMTTFQLFRR